MPQFSLKEMAILIGALLRGDGKVAVSGVSPLETAKEGDLALVVDKRHLKLAAGCRASGLIVKDDKLSEAGELKGFNLLVAKNPQLAFAKAIEALRPEERCAPGIHPLAVVSNRATIGKDASIQALVVIEDGAEIGDNAVIYPGAYIGRDASVGAGSIIYSGVQICEGSKIGKRVIIHSNSVVGSDGFGYARDGAGYYKIPQRGIVRIEDDVELGACVTVDRATLGETVIERGAKIDNLVQIAHNVRIGRDAIIVAQVGVAGSSTIGDRAQIGGQAGVVGHIEIGDDAMIGAQSGVSSDVPKATVVSGSPAIAHTEWLRAVNVFARLPEMKKRLLDLEKRLERLEGAKKPD